MALSHYCVDKFTAVDPDLKCCIPRWSIDYRSKCSKQHDMMLINIELINLWLDFEGFLPYNLLMKNIYLSVCLPCLVGKILTNPNKWHCYQNDAHTHQSRSIYDSYFPSPVILTIMIVYFFKFHLIGIHDLIWEGISDTQIGLYNMLDYWVVVDLGDKTGMVCGYGMVIEVPLWKIIILLSILDIVLSTSDGRTGFTYFGINFLLYPWYICKKEGSESCKGFWRIFHVLNDLIVWSFVS